MTYGALLSFDAATHTYRLPDGTRVPSVTEILRATGVSFDFEALGDRSERIREAIELKSAIGTALHADAHSYDDGVIDWETIDPRVRPYLDAWVTFRANQCLRPITRERRVYHPGMKFAGTLDGIFLTATGTRVLVDIKTGDPDLSGCRFQTAAYRAAYALDNPAEPEIAARWGVQLAPGRAVPYLITPYMDWQDDQIWRAIMTTYYAGAGRRAA